MKSKNSNQFNVTATLLVDTIYQDSMIELVLQSQSPFSTKISGQIVNLITGRYDENNPDIINSDLYENNYTIKVNLLKWLEERRVFNNDENKTKNRYDAENRYGMRFYPFTSSRIIGEISVIENHIDKVIINLPDQFRFIWNNANIFNPNGELAERNHSQGNINSRYAFLWKDNEKTYGSYKFNIPVRLGANQLFRLIHFPIIYVVLALIAVALASFLTNPSLLIAAIIGTWTFLLRRLDISNLPQFNTFLMRAYIYGGIFIPIWGMLWKILASFLLPIKFPSIFKISELVDKLEIREGLTQHAGLYILIILFVFILFFGIFILIARHSLNKFNNTGTLPLYVAKRWSKKIKKDQKSQRDALKNINTL